MKCLFLSHNLDARRLQNISNYRLDSSSKWNYCAMVSSKEIGHSPPPWPNTGWKDFTLFPKLQVTVTVTVMMYVLRDRVVRGPKFNRWPGQCKKTNLYCRGFGCLWFRLFIFFPHDLRLIELRVKKWYWNESLYSDFKEQTRVAFRSVISRFLS